MEAKPHEQQHGGRAWPRQHINADEDSKCCFPGRPFSSPRCTTELQRHHMEVKSHEQQTAVGPGPGSIPTRMKIASADSRGDLFHRPGAPLDPCIASGRNSHKSRQRGPEAGWGPGEARDVLARLLSPAALLCPSLRPEPPLGPLPCPWVGRRAEQGRTRVPRAFASPAPGATGAGP